MSITVADMMQMEPFSRFRLVAGMNGIERQIDTVNILDFEYSPEYGSDKNDRYFEENALVLSSLLFAKGQPRLLLKMIDDLVQEGVAALAVKTVLFSELPEEMIDYATQNQLPVFTFGEHDGHFEDIISFLMDEIRKQNDDRHLEQNLNLLINDTLPRLEVQRIAFECAPHLKMPYQFAALYPQNPGTLSWQTIRRARRSLNVPLLLYQKTLFALVPQPEPGRGSFSTGQSGQTDTPTAPQLQALYQLLPVSVPVAHIGCSRIHERLDEFDYALREALYACDYARRSGESSSVFSEMGILQILYPYHANYWMNAYYREILQKIQDYDTSYHTEFLKTAEAYIQADADAAQTAQLLHIHKNTVHYRINKLRELLGADTTLSFYEQLLFAVRCYEFFQ